MKGIVSLLCGMITMIFIWCLLVTKIYATPEELDTETIALAYDPIIIDTVNVFDIYVPPVTEETIVQEELVFPLSDEDLDLAARIVHAEAGNQSFDGKKLVAGVIFNRIDNDRFPNDVKSVVSQSGQFSTYSSGAYKRYSPDEIDYNAVISEVFHRTDPEALYFNCGGYISATSPLYKVGDHYFSK